jgi:4-hydroxy-tetrahydrodipicolinate reductase
MAGEIRVVVCGARGKMGRTVSAGIAAQPDMAVVAEVDLGDDLAVALNSAAVVMVDFTAPDAAFGNAQAAFAAGVAPVVGTTGMSAGQVDELARHANSAGIGGAVIPNFAIGAVLMMRFAELAAPWFESAEVIELHHANKVDAPSGTALRTAGVISEARANGGLGAPPDATKQEVAGARGARVDDVRVHSVRLSGLVAHQEVLFGGHGETLTIRHDSLDRASFMPGVLLAVRGLASLPAGLTVGIEPLLGLG